MTWMANPIWVRESRCRWRHGRFFLLLFLYACLVTGFMVWMYANHASYIQYDTRQDLRAGQIMASTGRELFRYSTLLQLTLWLLIAPTLTTSSIAGEREAGLLEGLQLSFLRPQQIVNGKLLSAYSILLLLIVVYLPTLSVCFMLGGVAPGEFLQALALQLVTALFACSLGLWFSARSYRPFTAMFHSFLFLGIWSAATWSASHSGSPLWPIRSLVMFLHPLAVADAILYYYPGVMLARAQLIFAAKIATLLLASFLLCRLAARATAKPMTPPIWQNGNPWVERLRRRWQLEKQQKAIQQAESARLADAKMLLLWEFPLTKFINFRNPILQREVRAKFRWRSVNRVGMLWRGLILILALSAWITCVFMAFTPELRGNLWGNVLKFGWIASTLALAIFAASSFSREREATTWEGLQLSSMSPFEVLWAKFWAPLITCFYYSIPFWPPLIICALLPTTSHNPYYYGTLPLIWSFTFLSIFVLISSAFLTTAFALLVSWKSRKSVIATTTTLTALLLSQGSAIVGMPLLSNLVYRTFLLSSGASSFMISGRNIVLGREIGQWEFMWQMLLHPYLALSHLLQPPRGYFISSFSIYDSRSMYRTLIDTIPYWAMWHCLFNLILCAILLAVLWRAMVCASREADHASTSASLPVEPKGAVTSPVSL